MATLEETVRRETWYPCGELNPGLRVENPANWPLFDRDKCGQGVELGSAGVEPAGREPTFR